jgi:hypothetical protein
MRLILVFTLWLFCLCYQVVGAGYRTANFSCSAPTPALAQAICESAEYWRGEMAVQWLGQVLPGWSQPCPITAQVAPNLGAGGATSFTFDKGEVFGWKMDIQGSQERLIDSVVPHEVTHTVFASHFRQPLPRWADEGACSTVECVSEKSKLQRRLVDYLHTGRGIPFGMMLNMEQYPADVLPLYSQGESVCDWLIMKKGRVAFISFITDGLQDKNWPRAVRAHYGFNNPQEMQNAWLIWLKTQ